MKATVLDMRRNTRKILEALERNEKVTLSLRGREIAEIIPKKQAGERLSLRDHPAFGLWKDRTEMEDPSAYVNQLRKGRFHDL